MIKNSAIWKYSLGISVERDAHLTYKKKQNQQILTSNCVTLSLCIVFYIIEAVFFLILPAKLIDKNNCQDNKSHRDKQ